MITRGTLIRHATQSGAVTTVSFGVHGAATGCCLMPSASFPLAFTPGVLSAAWHAVNLASVTPPTDKSVGTATGTQKHSEGLLINTCGHACPTIAIVENSATFYRPRPRRYSQRLDLVSDTSEYRMISARHCAPVEAGQQ